VVRLGIQMFSHGIVWNWARMSTKLCKLLDLLGIELECDQNVSEMKIVVARKFVVANC